ncbi:hypothetical protein V5E97_34780 [Singulisphaera sp. Ch08]|uniref:DUF11 domain-containing protein n=1 Tax=Singulisphaera sp. Ch08 TaxID=3120278 RepID=A0AAU7CEF7_9BACT
MSQIRSRSPWEPRRRSRRRSTAVRALRWAVEHLESRVTPATIAVTGIGDTIAQDGVVTLREAITSVNDGAAVNIDVAASGAYGTDDTINFAIPGLGIRVITVTGSALPDIVKTVIIDGFTQPGSSFGAPRIQLDGDATSLGAAGLTLSDVNGALIRGLDITNFDQGGTAAGIRITGGSNNRVQGNFIGTDASGTGGQGNRSGVLIQGGSTGNFIGTDGDGNNDAAEGNVISSNFEGVVINSDNNRVSGNFIGTDVSGTADLGNTIDGVNITLGTGNIIGTNGDGVSDTLERNVISGHIEGPGVMISGPLSTGNRVAGNLIGTDLTGTLPVSNFVGVQISNGASGNIIGTNGDGVSDTRERNIISGNTGDAVQVNFGSDNRVSGNYIGTGVNGVTALPNLGDGVSILQGTGNIIGTNGDGTADDLERNVISRNNTGVIINGTNNRVSGNFIGTDANGTAALSNTFDGITISAPSSGNIIGTNGDGMSDGLEGNVISGNNGHGVVIDGDENRVSGNRIGTDVTGTAALPNFANGVLLRISASNNVIGAGSDAPGDAAEGNIIAFNPRAGVAITGASSTGNRISRNSIFANDALGIDLNADGVTPNDPGDEETGPNDLLNFPVLTSAQIEGPNLILEGFARPGSEIELFIADPDPTGFGEGKTYLVTRVEGGTDDLDATTGSYGPTVHGLNVGSDTTNRFRFVIPLASLPGVAGGTALTSTATIAGTTSEFSGNVAVAPPLEADLAVTKTVDDPAPNVGDLITFTITVTNNGPGDATGVQVGDLLPLGVSFLAATPSQGNYSAATGLWTVGDVANGTSQTLLITAMVTSPGVATNNAVLSGSDQVDPNSANNSAAVVVTPRQADLAVTKTVDDPAPSVGDLITFTITVTDNGPDDATGVQIGDLLPTGVTFLTATASQGTYDVVTGIWSVGDVANGTSQTLRISAWVTSPAVTTNLAAVSRSSQFDPNAQNNSATAVVTPRTSDLEITKTVNNPSPQVGDTITYAVTVSNHGSGTATGVEVTDRLPSGLLYVTSTASQGTFDPATGVWSVGAIVSEARAVLMIQARVVTAGPQANFASITGLIPIDPNPGNNVGNVVVTARPVEPPTVTSIKRFGFHAQQTELVLTFSTDLDPDRASNASNYLLTLIGPRGRLGPRIPFASLDYSPVTDAVTLHPVTRLPLRQRYRLVVNGMAPNGLTSTSGMFLDGLGNGKPGSNYTRVFGVGILAGPNPRIRASTPGHHQVAALWHPARDTRRQFTRRHPIGAGAEGHDSSSSGPGTWTSST